MPDLNLFVDRAEGPAEFKARPMDKLAELDPGWKNHRLEIETVDAQFQSAMATLLEPHGFMRFEEKGAYEFAFVRPLSKGGGRQVVSYGSNFGVQAEVQSERLLAVLRSVGWPGELRNAGVVKLSLSEERGKEPDWGGTYPHAMGSGSRIAFSMEHIAHALEDFERLVLPSLEVLHTAHDLWMWYQRPYGPPPFFPGFSNESAVFAWLADAKSAPTMSREAMYTARYLPDERYIPLLEAWEVFLRPIATQPATAITLKCAKAFRQLPQTPADGPL